MCTDAANHGGQPVAHGAGARRLAALLMLVLLSTVVGCEQLAGGDASDTALVASAVERGDGQSPGAFFYALAIDGVTTQGTVGPSDHGAVTIPLAGDEVGVFVVHASCDCDVTVRAYRAGRLVEEASARGEHTVARVRFGASDESAGSGR